MHHDFLWSKQRREANRKRVKASLEPQRTCAEMLTELLDGNCLINCSHRPKPLCLKIWPKSNLPLLTTNFNHLQLSRRCFSMVPSKCLITSRVQCARLSCHFQIYNTNPCLVSCWKTTGCKFKARRSFTTSCYPL